MAAAISVQTLMEFLQSNVEHIELMQLFKNSVVQQYSKEMFSKIQNWE